MSRPNVRIYTGNGDYIDREMNNEEYAQQQKDEADALEMRQALAQAAVKKAAAEAKLAALGLTADDLAALGL